MDNKETEVVQTGQPEQKGWAAYPTRTKVLFGILIVMVIAAAGAGVWYWRAQQHVAPPPGGITVPLVNDNEQSAEPSVAIDKNSIFAAPALSYEQSQKPNPNTNVQWETAKPLNDLKLILGYSNGDGTMQTDKKSIDPRYFEVGTHNGNQIVLAQAAGEGLGPYNISIFLEKIGNNYTLMSLMSSPELYDGKDSSGVVLSNQVTAANMKTYYSGLVGPDTVTYNGFTLTQPYLTPTDFWTNFQDIYKDAKEVTFSKVSTLPQGTLYLQQTLRDNSVEGQKGEQFYIRRYHLVLPSGFYTSYGVKYDFISDNGVPNITWADGSKNSDPYRSDAALGGCGNPGAYVTPATDISNAVKVAGTTSTGVTVYEFSDSGNHVLRYFYDQMGGQIYSQDQQKMVPITIEEWYKHHPVIAVKNALGQFMLMSNGTYGVQAECGKPVVYLYPTKTTKVSIKVGADVTKSEPAYNEGWAVTANPNGMLVNSDGKTYDSLFWEGLGHGEYPEIKEGFVVKQADLASALRTQLKQQGLNDKESNDFLDFWMAKMPTTPYVRLTWFTTDQMNHLAPLAVTPRPDTVIRVFLDFQGLQQPITLPQQHLNSIPRKGFTLVEWGGLLRD